MTSIFHLDSITATAQLAHETHLILLASDVTVKGWNGMGEPVFTAGEISFNGDADSDEAEGIFALGDNEDPEGDIDTNDAP